MMAGRTENRRAARPQGGAVNGRDALYTLPTFIGMLAGLAIDWNIAGPFAWAGLCLSPETSLGVGAWNVHGFAHLGMIAGAAISGVVAVCGRQVANRNQPRRGLGGAALAATCRLVGMVVGMVFADELALRLLPASLGPIPHLVALAVSMTIGMLLGGHLARLLCRVARDAAAGFRLRKHRGIRSA
jgi:hypothetical protein